MSLSWLISGLVVYISIIIAIGLWSTRFSKGTLEDYTMASRSLGLWVLFSSVFAANISAVTFIGIPGISYHVGWISWPYFVTSWAWFTPLVFWIIFPRAWKLSKKFGLTTQSEIIRNRWNSKSLGYIFSTFVTIWTMLFLITGIKGGGTTISGLTDGRIPYWLGALIITVVVCIYLMIGGLRGAAWINVLQSTVFIIGIIVIFFMIADAYGGPAAATQEIAEQYPELLSRARMSMPRFYSFGITLALAVPMYPMLFMRMLAGSSPKALKGTVILYPVAGLIIFAAASYIGMWSNLGFQGLVGAESDYILPMTLVRYLPPIMISVLGSAIFAAIMSTMDAQLWAVSVILVKDFIVPSTVEKEQNKKIIKTSKIITLVIAAITYLVSLTEMRGIIRLSELMNAGFAPLIWPILGALYWKRCTKEAVAASIITSQAFVIGVALNIIPDSWNLGLIPGFPGLLIGLIVLIVVPYLKPAANYARREQYFKLFERDSS